MKASLFPPEMMQGTELSMESVAAKLSWFHLQLHLLHWQTQSYAEHMALGGLYDYVHDFKDGVIEKLMGYTGKRIKSFKIDALSDTISSTIVVSELISFSQELMKWAESNGYWDVSNLAQSLSGESVKVRYLLTLT